LTTGAAAPGDLVLALAPGQGLRGQAPHGVIIVVDIEVGIGDQNRIGKAR
jgi:hypothetical protein